MSGADEVGCFQLSAASDADDQCFGAAILEEVAHGEAEVAPEPEPAEEPFELGKTADLGRQMIFPASCCSDEGGDGRWNAVDGANAGGYFLHVNSRRQIFGHAHDSGSEVILRMMDPRRRGLDISR